MLMPTREQLGTRLRWWREIQGLQQDDVAIALGKPPSWVSHVETGRRYPTVENLFVWVHYLKIQDYIFQPFGEGTSHGTSAQEGV